MKLLIICFIILCSTAFFLPVKTAGSITDDVPEISILDGQLTQDGYTEYSTQKIAWGLGPSINEKNQPTDAVQAQKTYGKYDAWFLNEASDEILLTFDNGYENGNTISILDTLKKHNVHAVFFVTSQYAIENPDLLERMIDEGHVIGNHSWNHKSFPELSIEALTEEIMSLHNYMIEHHQYSMTLLRPPMGEFSEQALKAAQDLGYTTMLWSYAYYDYNVNDQPDYAESCNKLISHLHENEILLLHAVSDTNKEIMDEFLDQTLNKGFKFIDPKSIS